MPTQYVDWQSVLTLGKLFPLRGFTVCYWLQRRKRILRSW